MYMTHCAVLIETWPKTGVDLLVKFHFRDNEAELMLLRYFFFLSPRLSVPVFIAKLRPKA